MDSKGTNSPECGGDWFLVREADCDEDEEDEELEELFENSDVSDLIDDTDVEQGNSLKLFNELEAEENERKHLFLKRKYFSPKARSTAEVDGDATLSPRLESMSLASTGSKVKKRLFGHDDSGVAVEDEIGSATEDLQVQVEKQNLAPSAETVETEGGGSAGKPLQTEGDMLIVKELLRARNRAACMFTRFKEAFGCGFTDLTRTFKSNKTCVRDWVLALFGVHECLYETSKTVLQSHCEYMHLTHEVLESGSIALFMLRFKSQKSRETIVKLMKQTLGLCDYQIMADPPKLRNTPAALFWYKTSMSSRSFTYGETPEWIRQQTLVSYQMEAEQAFKLTTMVQWAIDNGFCEEHKIAYEYAQLATTDENAASWLASNSQAKYVRDCAVMVKHYLRAQMHEMSMAEYIQKRVDSVDGEADYRDILKFLRHHNVSVIGFLGALKPFFKGIPKKNCIVLYGPSNTGKSMFCMSLLKFMRGKVLSFANSKSHFWLQPLADTKLALLDDATYACWNFIDTYMRNALDGYPVSLDCKHKAPIEIKCPPLLITTNVQVHKEDTFKYLHSRLTTFEFTTDFPTDDRGDPIFNLTDVHWKSFFKRFAQQLELTVPDDEEDGEAS